MSGIERIAEAFEAARADGYRAALMPYMMGGYPDLERSREIARAYVEAGAGLIELGVPFSDPLADGPVIQAAGGAALRAGVSVADVFELARGVAADIPVVLMCYANQVLTRGLERFADALVDVGACGLIVPDLPLEEAGAALEACDQRGLALVPLMAPTTPDERMRADRLARPWVSLCGLAHRDHRRAERRGAHHARAAGARLLVHQRSHGRGFRDRHARAGAGRCGRRRRRRDRRQPTGPRRR